MATTTPVFPRPGYENNPSYARGFAEGEEFGLTADDPGNELGDDPPVGAYDLGFWDGVVWGAHHRPGGACLVPSIDGYDDIFHDEDGSHRVTPVPEWVRSDGGAVRPESKTTTRPAEAPTNARSRPPH
jgi:hypothetical protein